ncbi:MAG: hypothetical protein WDN46_23060 [Methylocella sp.]
MAMSRNISDMKRKLLVVMVEKGLRADEIFARLPAGTFASIDAVRVHISNLRRDGTLPPPAHARHHESQFTMKSMGESLWMKLIEQSRRRCQSPWDFACNILDIVLSEPALLRNLLDEVEDHEAAE